MHQNSTHLVSKVMAALLAVTMIAGCGDSPEKLIDSARTFVQSGDDNSAVIQLKNALQENPDLADARYLLGKIYFDRGEMANALKELERAYRLGISNDEIYPMLARAELRQGMGSEVIKKYEGKALNSPEENADLLTVIGDAYLATDITVSEKKYNEALKLNPDNALALLGLARIRVSQQKFEEAMARLDEVVKKSPKIAEPYFLKAIVLLAQKDRDGALAMYRKAAEVEPKNQTAHFQLVSGLIQTKRLEEAKVALAAMERAVGKTALQNHLAALIAFREGDSAKARDLIQEVVKVAPDYLPGRLLAGAIFYRLNDQLQAQANLKKVIEAAPKNVMARQMMVMSYIAQRDSGRAIDLLEPMLEEAPASSELLNLAGQAYLLAGDFERASHYFSIQVEKAPEDAQAMTRLGISRLAGGELEQGLSDLATASHLDTKFAYADIARVTALLSARRFEEALKAQADLEKKIPDNPVVLNLRGGVLLGLNRRAEAAEAFREALKIDLGFLPAGRNLARILVAEGKTEDARSIFLRMAEAKPKRADITLARAEFETAVGGEDGLIRRLYDSVIESDPGVVQARINYAGYLANKKESKRALEVIREAQSIAPEHPAVFRMLAKVLLLNGDQVQAIAALQKLADLAPTSSNAWLELGAVHLRNGDLSAAESSFKRAISVSPKNTDAYIGLIPVLMKAKNYDEALRFSRALQRERPDASAGYLAEADVYAARKDWSDAIRMAKKAHETWPSTVTISVLHRMFVKGGQLSDAKKLYAGWTQENPGDLVAKAKVAENLMSAGEFKDAEAIYADLVAKTPNNALALNNLAWLFYKRKDAGALEYASRAMEIAPDSAAILDTLGVIEVWLGKTDSGLAHLERAAKLAPNVADIQLNLAEAYLNTGRKDAAKAIIDSLTAVVPKDAPIAARLADVVKKL